MAADSDDTRQDGRDRALVLAVDAIGRARDTVALSDIALLREVARSLYAPWAAHLAWNAVLVTLLHAPVSGIVMRAPDYRVLDAGPDWATGGTWGPEGGWFAAFGLTAAIWFVYWRARRRTEPDV